MTAGIALATSRNKLGGGIAAQCSAALAGGGTRTPPHPGQFLDSRFLKPLGITQDGLARGLGVSRRRVNELVRGRRAISADTAIRLGLYFRTGPAFWMNLQQAWDMYLAWRAWRRGEVPAA